MVRSDGWMLGNAARTGNFFTTLVMDPESIEHKHPLVHLELINVEMTHELDDSDGFLSQRVVRAIALLSIVLEDSDELGEQVRPQSLQSLCQFASAKTKHKDAGEQEERLDKLSLFLIALETVCHLLQ